MTSVIGTPLHHQAALMSSTLMFLRPLVVNTLGQRGLIAKENPYALLKPLSEVRSIPTHQTSLSISSASILAVLYTSFNNMTPRLEYRFDESWCLKWQNLLVHLVVCHQLAVNDATFHVLGQGVLDDLCDEGDIIWDQRRLLR